MGSLPHCNTLPLVEQKQPQQRVDNKAPARTVRSFSGIIESFSVHTVEGLNIDYLIFSIKAKALATAETHKQFHFTLESNSNQGAYALSSISPYQFQLLLSAYLNKLFVEITMSNNKISIVSIVEKER